ncbi:MAG: efflux transporter outer membrane subunit [Legionellales bacterium]
MLAACSFAPKLVQPPMPIPLQYKETGTWVATKPLLAEATAKEPWWMLFHDRTLNALEMRLSCDNTHLKSAVARYQEARAVAQATRSAKYPTIDGIATVARQKDSNTFAGTSGTSARTFNTLLFTAVLNYEVDAWGRVRNAVLASDSLARASGYDVAAIGLSVHTELAADYFELRGYDAQQRVLENTVKAYKKALYLTRERHKGGLVPVSDVDAALAQWEDAKTASSDNRLKRAQLEHAIAVLIGAIPSNFHLKPTQKSMKLVRVAPELPSTLLVTRPDIAAASERLRAANAQIGFARAAFFPQFNLIGLIGVQSSTFSELFKSNSLIWSLGPSTALTLIQPEIEQVLFDGFKLQALLRKAKASYYESVNLYKEGVLVAFREVEDNLVAIHRLEEEMTTQTLSTSAAKRALYQANQQYKGGLVTYLDVVVYENKSLQSELNLIAIKTRRQLASIQLIKALGGGWSRNGSDS